MLSAGFLLACYRPSVALQELSIQRYCYRYASSLLAIVSLQSVERAIVGLSSCRVRLFSGIAIDMLALYWLALVLHSVEPAIVRLSPCWLSIGYRWSALCRACYRPFIVLQGASIQLYCYRYASSLYPCWRYCTLSSLLSLVYRPAGAVIQLYCYRYASSLFPC